MAEIQAMDNGFENRAAAREKVLAYEANKQQRAAARDKALADKLRQAAAREKALVDKSEERREAVAHAKALAAKVFAVQALAIAPSLPPCPTSYAGAVLSTLGGEPSAGCAVISTIAYHRQSTSNGMPMHPTLPSHWALKSS